MLEPGPFDYFYSFLLDPNVIFLLFIVAMLGIYLEISHPGAIVPGVAGGIALVLFLFAVGSITPNWAGLALEGTGFCVTCAGSAPAYTRSADDWSYHVTDLWVVTLL